MNNISKIFLIRKAVLFIKNPFYVISTVYYLIEKFFIKHGIIKKKKKKLIIIDDLFPHPISAFRFSEYLQYLEEIKDVHIYTTGNTLSSIHQENDITSVIKAFKKNYPSHRNKVSVFNPHQYLQADLAYLIFLDNAYSYLHLFEKQKIPFVFTLYPGGGFFLNNNKVNKHLSSIFNSSLFRKVIVTQIISLDYLIKNNFCPINKISFIYGAVLPTNIYGHGKYVRKIFGEDKTVLDVCFVANKQMKGGIDKGFDVFMEVANIYKNYSAISFHVVGPFTKMDSQFNNLKNVDYYGMLETINLKSFLNKMDIILSPNKPFILREGAFDGFPTASCTEASLMGVAMFITDFLKLNLHYTHMEDVVIIDGKIENIKEKIDYFLDNPMLLAQLSKKGKAKTEEIFSIQNQVGKRLDILGEFIK